MKNRPRFHHPRASAASASYVKKGSILFYKTTRMSHQNSAREPNGPGPRQGPRTKSQKDDPYRSLWRLGALFHASRRYSRRADVARVDRLASILRKGLLAPASCPDGSVCSDLNLVVTGVSVPYSQLVFLHRFGPQSAIYTACDPGRFIVFVDPAIAVLSPESMGQNWCVLCQDEVYVRNRVPAENLIAVVVHPLDGHSVMTDCLAELQHRAIPLYDSNGDVLWQPA
jgi:hypothetical protein